MPKVNISAIMPIGSAVHFGTVIGYDSYKVSNGTQKTLVVLRCKCGKTYKALYGDLNRDKVKSCGCVKAEKARVRLKRHGMAHSRLYNIWSKMKARCTNPNDVSFYNYGARGISICDDWANSFDLFKEWAIWAGYEDNLEIDRIDNNGNYCPENCRWANDDLSSQNRRSAFIVTYEGEQMPLSVLCKKLNLKYLLIYKRLKRGWTINQAINSGQ